MSHDGEYSVWFRTPRGEGTGIVYLVDGRITGGDCMFTYGGSYQFDDDRFTATLTTRRHADGPTTVFGVDEVEASLSGTFKGATAVCSGTAAHLPGLRFEARLFPSSNTEATPDPHRPSAKILSVPLPKPAERLPRAWRGLPAKAGA